MRHYHPLHWLCGRALVGADGLLKDASIAICDEPGNASIVTWTERRSEPRYATCEWAVVTSPCSEGKDSRVEILDVSKRGIRIACGWRISVGTRVRLRLKSLFVDGDVRYCATRGDRFHLGLCVIDVVEGADTGVSSGTLKVVD